MLAASTTLILVFSEMLKFAPYVKGFSKITKKIVKDKYESSRIFSSFKLKFQN
jgi:hypothetical protein